MISSTKVFLAHVAAHAGDHGAHVDAATHAVLAEIGSRLGGAERELVAEELPPELAWSLCGPGGMPRPVEEQLCAGGLSLGTARELIASVCHTLAERLSREALAAVRAAAPPSIASFLAADDGELERTTGSGSTLADGRPGSRHPLSEGKGVYVPRRS
ncbi:MAG TPA: DUF2267 domain-containing protein [Kofleriaceae bacterium]